MDVQQKLRELIALQLGDQILKLCELQAVNEALQAELAQVKADRNKEPDGDLPRVV